MYKTILAKLSQLHTKQAPATGLGLFRVLYGLVTLQEIFFLLYFNHLIFDPIPYLDVEFPTIPFFSVFMGSSGEFCSDWLSLLVFHARQLSILDSVCKFHYHATRF
jgi:hypothetical protein